MHPRTWRQSLHISFTFPLLSYSFLSLSFNLVTLSFSSLHLFFFFFLSLPELQARRRPTPTRLAATPYSKSFSGGKGRCTASSPSSTWRGMRGGPTRPALTVRLVWREPRSTKACWHLRSREEGIKSNSDGRSSILSLHFKQYLLPC